MTYLMSLILERYFQVDYMCIADGPHVVAIIELL